MKRTILTLGSLAIVLTCLFNNYIHFLTGWGNQLLLGLTFVILIYQALTSYREISKHKKNK